MSLVNCYNTCILQSKQYPQHIIILPDQIKKNLGKNQTTNPEDLELSDIQFRAITDTVMETVEIRVIGHGNPFLNGNKMCRGQTYMLVEGDLISFAKNEHEYVVHFTKLNSPYKLR